MKLRKVCVKNFKCVEDSMPFKVGPITCLVGKNESGKTALLQALYRLNPVVEAEAKAELSRRRSKSSILRERVWLIPKVALPLPDLRFTPRTPVVISSPGQAKIGHRSSALRVWRPAVTN